MKETPIFVATSLIPIFNRSANMNHKITLHKQLHAHFYHRLWTAMCFIMLSPLLMAQNIIVQSFQLDEMDLTANTTGSIVYDLNGDKCALIKVETTQKGFTFDGGMLGVMKVDDSHVGEIWVYVPDKLSHLSIAHPQLGMLRNYDLGQSVKKGRTYILKLSTGTVQTKVQQTVMSQYLVFKVTPKDAAVRVNNEAWFVSDGSASKFVPFGSYEYRVSSNLYHPEVGRVEVNDPNNKVDIAVELKPAFGYISVPAIGELAGATIYIDEQSVGQTPFTSAPLVSGPHTIMAVKQLYQSKEETVIVADGQTLTVRPTLPAYYSTVTLTVDNNAEIYVNGELKGVGRWTGKLASGTYALETRLANHQSASTTKQISAGKTSPTIHLDAPIPIYGSLNISTKPDDAEVYLDNQLVGKTPLFLQQSLVGTHQVRISKTKYVDYQTDVTIHEGEMTEVGGMLSNVADVSLSCNAANAVLYIDGTMVGPLSQVSQLEWGHHKLTLKADGYKDYSTSIDITNNHPSFHFSMVFLEGEQLSFTVQETTFTMIFVKGGTFQMGATPEQVLPRDDEKPVHSVTLSDFAIGETEVTQSLWEAVMGLNPSSYKSPNHPVEQISWDDCQIFIQKLDSITGKKFRLPTEAEWEYAARGGNKSKGYQYAGSNNLNQTAWFSYYSSSLYNHNLTHEVKLKKPNELGLYDMSGNVSEWCQDWISPYSLIAVSNPSGPTSGVFRVVRGGNCNSNRSSCRSSFRGCLSPSIQSKNCGLRLAL
jgi:formylglycine-generating enzyme required for sulfatase activity